MINAALEHLAEFCDSIAPGTGAEVRDVFQKACNDLLPLAIAASSGAEHELAYYA